MGLKTQATRFGMSIPSFILGLSMSCQLLGTLAIPITSSVSSALYEDGPNGFGVNIWISNVTDVIFGEDATDFDYHIVGETTSAIESVETFATVFATNETDAVLAAFLNATMSGTMTAQQATNKTWFCGELSSNMASMTESCAGVSLIDSSKEIDKRANSRWNWIKSGAHVSSTLAMDYLQRSLESELYQSFSKSPRSWCAAANSITACVSWSKVEEWNHYYAQEMVGDALTAVDFNSKSAQANGILSRKRSGADVCLSNRATGCT